MSPLAASSSLADVQDNDVTSCWEPAAHASDLNVETFITLHTNDTLTFPLEVEVKLQAVSGCGDDPSVPLLLSLSTPPSIFDGSGQCRACQPGGHFSHYYTGALSYSSMSLLLGWRSGEGTYPIFKSLEKKSSVTSIKWYDKRTVAQ